MFWFVFKHAVRHLPITTWRHMECAAQSRVNTVDISLNSGICWILEIIAGNQNEECGEIELG